MVHWGPGGAYLPVILHVVAQADEAGLEFLWPQRPAVVLPGVQRQVCMGWCGEQASTEVGEGPGLHAEGRGMEETHMEEGNRVRSDVDKAMARDSWRGVGGLEDSQRLLPTSSGLEQGGELNGPESRTESQDWGVGVGGKHILLPGSGVGEKGLHSTLCKASRSCLMVQG